MVSSLQEGIRLRQQLSTEWGSGRNPNLDKCGELLDRIKVILTNLKFLPGSSGESSREELILARDILEIGAFWSIAKKDIPSFERYMAQLKCYYLDFKDDLPESSYKSELLGLNLLCLLSQNRVAEFHTELELFAFPDVHILENIYIKHAVSLEQYLMEGRYNKPPGTAKTQLACAAANECWAYFITMSISEIMCKYMGESEKMIKKLFKLSKEKQLSIIFVDEVDSIMAKRSELSSEDNLRVKATLLVEMTEVCQNHKVFIIGATNMPELLDSAFLRRFEVKEYTQLPTAKEREDIFKLTMKKFTHALTEKNFQKLGLLSIRFSGADIKKVVKDANYIPVRRIAEERIQQGHFSFDTPITMIFQAKRLVPAEAYNFFIDILLDTLRDEISTCIEKSYTRLTPDAAAKALNLNMNQLRTYAARRDWKSTSDGCYSFHVDVKQENKIPSFELAKDAIDYAKELEMII